jgi:hypothetical protein
MDFHIFLALSSKVLNSSIKPFSGTNRTAGKMAAKIPGDY